MEFEPWVIGARLKRWQISRAVKEDIWRYKKLDLKLSVTLSLIESKNPKAELFILRPITSQGKHLKAEVYSTI